MPTTIIDYLNQLAIIDGVKKSTRFGRGPPIQVDRQGHLDLPEFIRPDDTREFAVADDIVQQNQQVAPVGGAILEPAQAVQAHDMGPENQAHDIGMDN